MDNEKLAAAFKMGKGVYYGCTATLTACGMGVLGSFLRSHHMLHTARVLARHEFEKAEENFKEGLDEWRSAS